MQLLSLVKKCRLLNLFVDNESVMAYPFTTVTKNRTGELATRAPTVAFLTCQVRAASRSN